MCKFVNTGLLIYYLIYSNNMVYKKFHHLN